MNKGKRVNNCSESDLQKPEKDLHKKRLKFEPVAHILLRKH